MGMVIRVGFLWRGRRGCHGAPPGGRAGFGICLCSLLPSPSFSAACPASSCAVKISRPHLVTFAMIARQSSRRLFYSEIFDEALDAPIPRVRANASSVSLSGGWTDHSNPYQRQPGREEGDLLFEIDPSTFQAAVDNAQAKLKLSSEPPRFRHPTGTPAKSNFTDKDDTICATCKTRKIITPPPSPTRAAASLGNSDAQPRYTRCSLLLMVT